MYLLQMPRGNWHAYFSEVCLVPLDFENRQDVSDMRLSNTFSRCLWCSKARTQSGRNWEDLLDQPLYFKQQTQIFNGVIHALSR